MDFQLSDDQTMFRDSLRRYLAANPRDLAEPNAAAASWVLPQAAGLAELGTFAALLPESAGGFGFGWVEAMIIGEELGRAVLPTAFVESVVIGGRLLADLGGSSHGELIGRIAQGDAIVALASADHEAAGGHPLAAGAVGLNGRFSQARALVPFAPVATSVLAIGREGDGALSAFLIDAVALVDAPKWWTIDGEPATTLDLDGIEASALRRVGASGAASPAVDEALDLALLVQSAELNGIMATLLNATSLHLRTRKQFGAVLASFQALQQRFADMVVAYEQAVSLTMRAAATAAPERARAAAAAKVQSTRSAALIGREAIQMHGAMGMTDELIVGPAVKRIRTLESRFGTPRLHLDRYRGGADG